MADGRTSIPPKIQGKQEPFEGQAASAAPSITDAEQRTGEASGQGMGSLAAERNAEGSPPNHGTRVPLEDVRRAMAARDRAVVVYLAWLLYAKERFNA